MSEPSEDAVAALKRLFFPRPEGQLAVLPVAYRWEAIRRHPYYLFFWESAARYYSDQRSVDPEEQVFQRLAAVMVRAAGTGNCPVDPAKPFSELDEEDLHPAWMSGAVQPPTVRFLATMLIQLLPPAERAGIGSILLTSGSEEYGIEGDDDVRALQRERAQQRLAEVASPVLDSFIDAPLAYFHVAASQNTILRDIEETVRYWKKRRNIKEVRVRPEKLSECLKVWDLREGWTGADYDRNHERSFPEIVRQMKRPTSTVFSAYRRGFELVTGYPFAPEMWQLLFLRLKFSRERAGEHLSQHVRRQLVRKSKRPIPDSVVSPGTQSPDRETLVTGLSMTDDTVPDTDKYIDIVTLIGKGRTDTEICSELELAEATDIELVRYLRQRGSEFERDINR